MTSDDLLLLIMIHAAQVVAVVGLVWLLTNLLKKRSSIVWALWLVVLVKCVTPPLIGASWSLFSLVEGPWMSRTIKPVDEPDGVLAVERRPEPPVITPTPTQRSQSTGTILRAEASRETHRLQATEVQSEVPKQTDWPSLILIALSLLSLLSFLGTLVRCLNCRRSIRQRRCPALEHEPQQMLEDLAAEIGLQRVPRVRVADVSFGPAVLGVWRPVVLLPKVLFDEATFEMAQLRPVLAHELAHIRRRDLWVGLLQALANCVWWFHPAVRLANRWLSRAAEHCCDEYVIEKLNCDPADYARCLLAVMECRTQLKPVPVFPGMTPVEITSQRMERIMTLKNGRRMRDKWKAFVVAVVVAAIVLPGAVRAVPQARDEDVETDGAVHLTVQNGSNDSKTFASAEATQSSAFDLEPVLERVTIVGTSQYGGHMSREQKLQLIRDYVESAVRYRKRIGASSKPAPGEVELQLSENKLIVRGDDDVFATVERVLTHLDVLDARPIHHEIRMITGKRAQEVFGVIGGSEQTDGGVTIKLVNEVELEKLTLQVMLDASSNVRVEPVINAYSGITCETGDTVPRSLAVGVQGGQTVTEFVHEGIRSRLKPTRISDEVIKLEHEVESSWISDLPASEIKTENGMAGVQVPAIDVAMVDTTVEVTSGQTVLINGLEMRSGTRREPAIVAITTKLPSGPAHTPAGNISKPRLLVVAYNVADLVAPVRNNAVEGETSDAGVYGAVSHAVDQPQPTIQPIAHVESSSTRPQNPSVALPGTMSPEVLKDLVINSVSSEKWGKEHKIVVNESTLSLVIRADNTTHDSVVDFLWQLRKLQDRQHVVEISMFTFESADQMSEIGFDHLHDEETFQWAVLSESETDVASTYLKKSASSYHAPRVRVFDEQQAAIRSLSDAGIGMNLRIDQQAESSLVRVDCQLTGSDEVASAVDLKTLVPQGKTLLLTYSPSRVFPERTLPDEMIGIVLLTVNTISAEEVEQKVSDNQ